jgi:hypothetical protein
VTKDRERENNRVTNEREGEHNRVTREREREQERERLLLSFVALESSSSQPLTKAGLPFKLEKSPETCGSQELECIDFPSQWISFGYSNR